MKDFLVPFLRVYPHIPSQALWRAIEASLLNPLPFKKPILDLGCGDGLFAKMLFSGRRNEIIGIDVSEACLTAAKSQRIYKGVILCDGAELPYKDNSFATVMSNCVLEHIVDDAKVLQEVSRVLKDGGLFVFTVPSENFIPNLINHGKDYVEQLNKRLEHFHYRSPSDWRELLHLSGLTLETFSYFLPRQVQHVWERLTRPILKKIIGRELAAYLGSRKMGLFFLVRAIVPFLFGRLLKKPYAVGSSNDGEGGALLMLARR